MSTWTPYSADTQNPYFHWEARNDPADIAPSPTLREARRSKVSQTKVQRFVPRFCLTPDQAARHCAAQGAADIFEKGGKGIVKPDHASAVFDNDLFDIPVPLPDFARKPDNVPSPPSQSSDPDGLAPKPDKGMVIVGIIDAALALGHMRFRRDTGRTRVLSCWLQDGIYEQGPSDLPFGKELTQAQINQAINNHSSSGVLDEAAMNHDLGLVNMTHAEGNRELLSKVSHGCHVLDLAAGYDPQDPVQAATADLRPIIAVNLPTRAHIGSSGTYLEYFVVAAIDHIMNQALQFAALGGDKAPCPPIVINLSYGLQAGPKDGSDVLERYMDAVTKEAASRGIEVHFVLPAGNENLDQLNAQTLLSPRKPAHVKLALRPEDSTDNFLEIYSAPLQTRLPVNAEVPLYIALNLPGETGTALSAGKDGHLTELSGPFGRIGYLYCDLIEGSAGQRIRYLLALEPTSPAAGGAASPVGTFTVTLQADANMLLDVSVQSDQSLGSTRSTGRAARLDHPDYQTHDLDGRLIDTPNPSAPAETCPVRRVGSINAITCGDYPIVVAGHRASDGQPALYSSSTPTGNQAPAAIAASFPTDDSPAQGGIRAAGSTSFSTVRMRGTSFAAGQATRMVADILASGQPVNLAAQASAADPDASQFAPEKIGSGRLPNPDSTGATNTNLLV